MKDVRNRIGEQFFLGIFFKTTSEKKDQTVGKFWDVLCIKLEEATGAWFLSWFKDFKGYKFSLFLRKK